MKGMIGFLDGTVRHMTPTRVLVHTNSGVGYSVFPVGQLLSACQTGKKIEMYIFTLVREQELALYGFVDYEEQKLFEKLLGVSGVGPKLAASILSFSVSQFLQAVETADIAQLTKIPGLGKKTAQRLLLDLKGKLDLSEEKVSVSAILQEAIEALMYLGYDQKHITEVIQKAPEGATSEDLVKYYLSHMHEK